MAFYRNKTWPRSRCNGLLPTVASLLACQAGESHAERGFSWSGGFVTKFRTMLSDEHLEMMLVIFDHLDRDTYDFEKFIEKFDCNLTQPKKKLFIKK